MKHFLETLIARLWNRAIARRRRSAIATGLLLGYRVVDENITARTVAIPTERRATHLALLGRTGSGKSSLIRFFCESDVRARRGLFLFDVHGDLTPAILSLIADEERRSKTDLSDRVIVVNPADTAYSVGLNPLETHKDQDSFLRVSQVSELLKQRWGLQGFGARTDELVRNSLFVLAENGLTLLELTPLLTDAMFRMGCLKNVTNSEVRNYFESRYGAASEAMQAVIREAVLNKVTAFSGDPHFRFIIGQQKSTFSIRRALDESKWVIVNIAKGQLGPEALTLGALLLTMIKHSVFERTNRELSTIYIDEVQNVIGYGGDLETMFAENRKAAVSVCTANQYLDQLSQEVRSAILAIGSLVCFQLSPTDAQFIATALDGGKPLAERLKNLSPRHAIVKSGNDPLAEIVVPEVRQFGIPWRDLYERSRARWARPRALIEAEISERNADASHAVGKSIDDWT